MAGLLTIIEERSQSRSNEYRQFSVIGRRDLVETTRPPTTPESPHTEYSYIQNSSEVSEESYTI